MPLMVMHLALIPARSGHAPWPAKSLRKNRLRDKRIVSRSTS